MTREEAIIQLDYLKDFKTPDQIEALDMAIKALELLGTLTDRPCSVCKFHGENGCSEWNCVFEESEET